MQIGQRIKELRKSKNLTLQAMAAKTGFSLGFLSNLERDQTSPTIDQLQTIADVFDSSLLAILSEAPAYQPVVYKDERDLMFRIDGKIRYEFTTLRNTELKGVCMTIEADNYEDELSWGHSKDEFGIITQGSIHMEIDGVGYELHEGDSIYIKRNTPHKFHKMGEGPCVSYWTMKRDVKSDL